jgi:AraC-like DNA-binding protein
VPRFRVSHVVATAELRVDRTVCDGCDPLRPCDEHSCSASIWLLTAGALEFRDPAGRHVLDPTCALLMPAGHPFVIRHPAGPDTCVSFHGPLIDRLAATGPRVLPISPAQAARLARELPDGDVAEVLVDIAAPAERTSLPDRELAGAIAHELRLGFSDSESLAELADRTGYSLFHACRVFRATTGYTIHGYRRELRLRHALSAILDGGEPLAEIAARVGFASQSHLTNLFRARFGITPAKARTRDGVLGLSRARARDCVSV